MTSPGGWPTTPDGRSALAECDVIVRPDGETALLAIRPAGGTISGVTAVVVGPPGRPFAVVNPAVVTELAWDDPTPASGEWVEVTPPTGDDPGSYQYHETKHRGRPGDDGDTVLDPGDFSATAGQVLRVGSDGAAFEAVDLPGAECFWPAAFSNIGSGNPAATLGVISVAARPYPRRPVLFGSTVVVGEGPDVRADLVGRIGLGPTPGSAETAGTVIARCRGISQVDRLTLTPGPAAGGAGEDFLIPANTAAMIYVRCERQAGSVTYTASAADTRAMLVTLAV